MIRIEACDGPFGSEDYVSFEVDDDWDLEAAIAQCRRMDAVFKAARAEGLTAYQYETALTIARARRGAKR